MNMCTVYGSGVCCLMQGDVSKAVVSALSKAERRKHVWRMAAVSVLGVAGGQHTRTQGDGVWQWRLLSDAGEHKHVHDVWQ